MIRSVAAPLPRDAARPPAQLQELPPPQPLAAAKAWASEQARLLATLRVHVRRELALPQRPVLALRAYLAEESRR